MKSQTGEKLREKLKELLKENCKIENLIMKRLTLKIELFTSDKETQK